MGHFDIMLLNKSKQKIYYDIDYEIRHNYVYDRKKNINQPFINVKFNKNHNYYEEEINNDKIKTLNFTIYKTVKLNPNIQYKNFINNLIKSINKSYIISNLKNYIYPYNFFKEQHEILDLGVSLYNVSRKHIYFMKLDLKNAFYSIDINQIYVILKHFTKKTYIEIIKDNYKNLTPEFYKEYLFIGLDLSKIIFELLMIYIFLKFYKSYKFKNIICFADDIILYSNSISELTDMSEKLIKLFHEFNLKINEKKSDLINLRYDDLLLFNNIILCNHSNKLSHKTLCFLHTIIDSGFIRQENHSLFLTDKTIDNLKISNKYIYNNLIDDSNKDYKQQKKEFLNKLKKYLDNTTVDLNISETQLYELISCYNF